MSGAWLFSSGREQDGWKLSTHETDLERQTVELLHDLGGALHLLALEAQEALMKM
jgi:hypothetical protein